MTARLQQFSEACGQAGGHCDRKLAQLESDVPKWLREQDSRINRQVDQVLGECRAEFNTKNSQPCPLAQQLQFDLEKIKSENQALLTRMEKLESLFGGREVPWQEMLDMYHRVSESVSGEVKRELDLRERNVIEMLVKQQFEDRLRDFQKEVHLEKLKGELTDMTREQLRIVSDKVFEHLHKERQERRKLRSEFGQVQRQVQSAMGRGASVVNAPSFPGSSVTMPVSQVPQSTPTVTLGAAKGADSAMSRPAATSSRAHNIF